MTELNWVLTRLAMSEWWKTPVLVDSPPENRPCVQYTTIEARASTLLEYTIGTLSYSLDCANTRSLPSIWPPSAHLTSHFWIWPHNEQTPRILVHNYIECSFSSLFKSSNMTEILYHSFDNNETFPFSISISLCLCCNHWYNFYRIETPIIGRLIITFLHTEDKIIRKAK